MSCESKKMMLGVAADKRDFTSRVLADETEVEIKWTPAQAALGLGFRREFWENLQGRALRADVGEDLVILRISDQALEAQSLGKKLWKDLVAGFAAAGKDQTCWKRTYNFLTLVLSASYQGEDLKPILEESGSIGVIGSRAFNISSFSSIYDHLMKGGSLAGLDLELADLHLAAASIYYGILGPGTRNEVLPPEIIGSAATR